MHVKCLISRIKSFDNSQPPFSDSGVSFVPLLLSSMDLVVQWQIAFPISIIYFVLVIAH